MSTPRAKTAEEARKDFLDHIRHLVQYWANRPDALNGLAFSILSAIDGSSAALPAFTLTLDPHPDDKQYAIDNGENWYEPGVAINSDCHLHDMYYKQEPTP